MTVPANSTSSSSTAGYRLSMLSRESYEWIHLTGREMVRPGLDLVCEMITLGVENLNGRSPSLERLRRYSEATGHAIEARIYAEIAHLNFKPAPGLLQKVVFPKEPWIRIDTWVSSGTTISPFYGKHIRPSTTSKPYRH